MNKKTEGKPANVGGSEGAVTVLDAKPAHVGGFAASLGIDLSGTVQERADMAAEHMNRSQRHMLTSGLLLASIKQDCEHGEFLKLIAERGFEERAAQKAMQYASFLLAQPEDVRARLVAIPQSRVMQLASADPQVIEAILEDTEAPIEDLSVRALIDRVRTLEAKITDVAVQRDKAEADLEAQRKRTSAKRTDQVPVVIAGFRQELAIAVERARLALDTVRGVLADCRQLDGGAGPWVDGTARLAAGGVASLQIELAGAMEQCLEMLPEGEIQFTAEARLSPQEVTELAERWHAEAGADRLEAQQREVMRANAARTGPGRRKTVPTK